MRVLFDLNIILDVVQKREPHYAASAAAIEAVVQSRVEGVLPAHALTTLHYVVGRYQSLEIAARVIDWLLRYFDIASAGREEFLRARALGWKDFEDAVVAASAEASRCDAIVTRNIRDYRGSIITVLTPEEYLLTGLDT